MNPLEIKHAVAGSPYRLARWITGQDIHEVEDDPEMLTMLIGAAYTTSLNMLGPLALIESGVRGDRLYSHTSFVRNNPWPKPIFHYTQAASKAERIGGLAGKKVFGKAGVKLGARVGGRLIPGVGWALLAYDVYDIAANRSLWGFDLS